MYIDKARRYHQPRYIQDSFCLLVRLTGDLGNAAILNTDVRPVRLCPAPVRHKAVFQNQIIHCYISLLF